MIASKLREKRKEKKYSMQKLGEITGLSTGNISDIENNKKLPGIKTLISLCEALNISADWLLFNREPVKLTQDEEKNLELYKSLTEREKGQMDLFLKQLIGDRSSEDIKAKLSS